MKEGNVVQHHGLYRSEFEHDNCGIGAIVNIKGQKSHDTVANALKIVENLEHRAGKDAEGKTGDGVGILLQVSHRFFSKVCKPLGIFLGSERDYGVGMFFFPQDELKRNQAKKIFEVIVKKEGMNFLGWREVPVKADVLGSRAVECMPCIMQGFIERPKKVQQGIDFDRKLYIVRRVFEQSADDTYVASLSSRTIAYKGMFLVDQLRLFFPDLQDPDYDSAIALVHSRFSTNTNPSWERAHPNRFIVHNGEINTIRGNTDKMRAREENMESECMKGKLHEVLPAVNTSGSDSAMLDNAIEFMVMSGMDLPLAVMIAIPEPWANNRNLSQKKKDFYQYYATMMEPWDGPASILFSDGDCMGAVLDRNGLRPSRYYITDDDTLILSSEVGVLDIPPEKIVVKERLHPGKMLLVDIKKGKVIDDEELKETYASRQPYGEWLDNNLIELKDLKIPNQKVPSYTAEECRRLQKAFGYSYEEVKTSILNMAKNGAEGTAAMGIDAPLAVLSDMHQNLFGYFKQRFAQVTNPPIDAIREKIVTSTTVYIGEDGNLLEEKAENFITEHPASLVSIYLLDKYFVQNPQPDLTQIQKLADRMTGELKDRPFMDALLKRIEEEEKVAVGKSAPYFRLRNAEEKDISRSNFKDQYLLIQFWASWDTVSRANNAMFRRIYKKEQKNKNFALLGVSLDLNKKKWQETIKADTLKWEQVCDFSGWSGEIIKQFAIQTLPTNILLSPTGRIEGKNLDEKAIENKLKEIAEKEKEKSLTTNH